MDCRISYYSSNTALLELRKEDVFSIKKCSNDYSLVPIELSLIQDKESQGRTSDRSTTPEELATEAV